jgi:hypothetical protein
MASKIDHLINLSESLSINIHITHFSRRIPGCLLKKTRSTPRPLTPHMHQASYLTRLQTSE